MSKGLGPVAVIAIIVVAALCIEGTILSNLIFRMENVRRAIREARIIEAINKMEFVKRALLISLDFSFYQASYDICGNGGFYQKDCNPYWRIYDAVYFPEFRENLKMKILEYLNNYANSLNQEVKVPSYDKIEFEKKAMTNLENAILCSYYRCSEPEKMKEIPECSEIYGTERYCNLDAESFPVEFYGKDRIEKSTLSSKMNLDCIMVEGISKQYSSFFDYFIDFLRTLQSYANLIVKMIVNLGKVELSYIIADKGAVVKYGQQENCWVLPSFDSLELAGEMIQIFTYKETFKLGIDPLSVVITVKTTFIKNSPPNLIDVNVSSSQLLTLEESDMKLTEIPSMKRRYFTQLFKMFSEAKSRFYDEDSIYNAIISAIDSLPSECKSISIASCSPIDANAKEILNQRCPNILESLENRIKDEISKLNSIVDKIEIIVEIEDVKTDSEGSCRTDFRTSPECCPPDSEDEECPLYVVVCNYNYYGAAKVLVRIKDNSEEYPVYDANEGTTDFRKNELRFYVLSGNKNLIEIPTDNCQS
ncbi:MAG: hypothetical protein QW609_02235 [Candidatus Aenigmatarchaeota archaeon]